MVYCCCTWKLLMSLKYTHYHANPPYIFLGGTSDSVSAVPFIWEGTADTWWYLHSSWSPDCFYWWEDRSHFSNIHVFENVLYGLLLKYGQFDEHTFTINAIPLIRSGGLSFFSFRFFFFPPPINLLVRQRTAVQASDAWVPLTVRKNSSKHVCVHLIEWMLPPQRGSPTTTFLQWSWLSV